MPSEASSISPYSIRSFVIRGGRLSPAQQRALDQLWSRHGIDWQPDQPLDWAQIFGRTAPVVLEIGFGMGESLVTMAQQSPETDFVGIEVHPPGIGNILQRIDQEQITNLKVLRGDAVLLLRDLIPHGSLTRVQIYFPDPWPKKRHHKRRLVQAPFAALAARKLLPGGYLHAATDWPDYAEQMEAVLSADRSFENAQENKTRPVTKFERRGRGLGHPVRDLLFLRRKK